MSDTAVSPPPKAPIPPKTQVERAGSYVSLVSTSLGVLGAVGTLFVWLTANFYVGDVEVRPDKALESVAVKAYDQKGQEASFHTPRFQLMPGKYHLEIVANGGTARHTDVVVNFRDTTVVDVEVSSAADEGEDKRERTQRKKHWWQFWR